MAVFTYMFRERHDFSMKLAQLSDILQKLNRLNTSLQSGYKLKWQENTKQNCRHANICIQSQLSLPISYHSWSRNGKLFGAVGVLDNRSVRQTKHLLGLRYSHTSTCAPSGWQWSYVATSACNNTLWAVHLWPATLLAFVHGIRSSFVTICWTHTANLWSIQWRS